MAIANWMEPPYTSGTAQLKSAASMSPCIRQA
jgi:hypothetical protein